MPSFLYRERTRYRYTPLLIREIVLYDVFSVEGGDDRSTSDFFNPLYVSDSPYGGYAKMSDDERKVSGSSPTLLESRSRHYAVKRKFLKILYDDK